MHRESDQHGPAMDDQLSRETEGIVRGTGSTHAEEWKEPEPTGEVSSRAREGGSPPGMSPEDVDARSQVAKTLAPLNFPVAAEEVVERFEQADVSEGLLTAARELPAEANYPSVTDVVHALGIPTEAHRT